MAKHEEGHRYTFGAPSKGWPCFTHDFRRLEGIDSYRCRKCGEEVGWRDLPQPGKGA